MIRSITLPAILCCLIIYCADPGISAAQNEHDTDWRSILHNLTGSWGLTGRMGDRELHQRCEGRWVLDQNFFQMDCEAIPPDTSGYRAKYLIGYHSEKKQYLFHLFDTFGGNYSETIGRGALEGNRIPFVFNYPRGAFQNTFVWDEDNRDWKMMLRQKNE